MNSSIHGDFVAAAARYPDKPAIWSEDGIMSYRELDQRSTALSRWLLNNDFAPAKRTALILPKSHNAVIAIIAILKAGNSYVPLGAGWSEGRLDKIIANGDFRLVITENENLALNHDPLASIYTGANDSGTKNDPLKQSGELKREGVQTPFLGSASNRHRPNQTSDEILDESDGNQYSHASRRYESES